MAGSSAASGVGGSSSTSGSSGSAASSGSGGGGAASGIRGASTTSGAGGTAASNNEFITGWFEWTDPFGGSLALYGEVTLADDCTAALSSMLSPEQLIYAHYDGTVTQFIDEAYLSRSRPDLDPPAAPIYLLAFKGELRDTDAYPGHTRELVIAEPSGDFVVSPNVSCLPYTDRYGCYVFPEVQSASFPCMTVAGSFPDAEHDVTDTTLTVTIDAYDVNCTDSFDDSYPDGVTTGEQTLTFDISDLEEDVAKELDAGPFPWRGSRSTRHECSTVLDGPTFCDCGWTYVDGVEIERGWILRTNGWIYMQLEGNEDFPDFNFFDGFQF